MLVPCASVGPHSCCYCLHRRCTGSSVPGWAAANYPCYGYRGGGAPVGDRVVKNRWLHSYPLTIVYPFFFHCRWNVTLANLCSAVAHFLPGDHLLRGYSDLTRLATTSSKLHTIYNEQLEQHDRTTKGYTFQRAIDLGLDTTSATSLSNLSQIHSPHPISIS